MEYRKTDFGLINVNPGYEEVRVTLPAEKDETASAAETGGTATGKAADSQTAESVATDSTVETGAEVDSQNADGTSTESGVEPADAQAAGSESTDSQGTESGDAADAKADGNEDAGEETADQEKVRPANEIEFETILGRNPDYIFLIYEGKERDAEKTYKAICESKDFWNDMTAVRNRHVYTLPQSTFAYPPNDQWDLAYEYLFQMTLTRGGNWSIVKHHDIRDLFR